MKMTRRLRRLSTGRSAFTLIELLVVVAIVALLISILLPVLHGARQSARSCACLSNLRQLDLAWQHYFDEHQGRFLQGINVNTNFGGGQGTNQAAQPPWNPADPLPKELNRYAGLERVATLDEAQVFHCPADRGVNVAFPTHYRYYGTSYTTNVIIIGPDQFYIDSGYPQFVRLSLSKVNRELRDLRRSRVTTNESELMLLGDATWWYAWDRGASPESSWHGKPGWHNLGFLDGHAARTRMHRRIFGTADYQLIPFRDLAQLTASFQPPPWPEE